MLRMMLVVAAAAIVGACATQSQGPAVSDLPPNYRAIIQAEVRTNFFDPYSIRDASISQPFAGTSLMGSTQTVCVRANAKNRMGGYTGAKQTGFTFRQGQLTATDNEYGLITCQAALYEPFPEIEEGYKPPIAVDQQKAKGKR